MKAVFFFPLYVSIQMRRYMTFEYDEKGKIFTDIVTKNAIPATI